MSSKSKTKTKGENKSGYLLTLPLKAEHADMLHKILNDGSPMALLPKTKENHIDPAAVWKFNELRKIVGEQRKPAPTGEFDNEELEDPVKWRKKHNLSLNFFLKKKGPDGKEIGIVFSIPDNVKGVLKHIIFLMPNVLPLGVHLKHWEAITISWRLTRWVQVHCANKALAEPDGESVDFDTDEEDEDYEEPSDEIVKKEEQDDAEIPD